MHAISALPLYECISSSGILVICKVAARTDHVSLKAFLSQLDLQIHGSHDGCYLTGRRMTAQMVTGCYQLGSSTQILRTKVRFIQLLQCGQLVDIAKESIIRNDHVAMTHSACMKAWP